MRKCRTCGNIVDDKQMVCPFCGCVEAVDVKGPGVKAVRYTDTLGGYGQTPNGGYGQTPNGGYGQTPNGGYGQTPNGGYGQTPNGGYGQTPNGGYGQTPNGGYGQTPNGGYGQTPNGGYGQMPNGGYSQNTNVQPPHKDGNHKGVIIAVSVAAVVIVIVGVLCALLIPGMVVSNKIEKNAESETTEDYAIDKETSEVTTTEKATTEKATVAVTEETTEGTEEATEEIKSGTYDPTTVDAPDTSNWTDEDVIYAYTWDNTFQYKLDIVFDKYPEYENYVKVVNLNCGGVSDDYVTGVNSALTGGDKYASIITADIDVAKFWSETDYTANLDELGFTDEVMADSYDFAVGYGTYNGHLKAVTWQSCAGSVFYRRDIAKSVFGTDDPETIQGLLADWDSFFETADKLAEAGYKIVSGPDDIKHAMLNNRGTAWVSTGSDGYEYLTLDDSASDYLELSKKIWDGGYSNDSSQWDATWSSDMQDSGNVFCYFGCPWFVGTMLGNDATSGNWGAVVGPASYCWGGTYMMAGVDTNNPELTAFILWALTCDPDIGVDITNQLGDCVNNKTANDRLINGGELMSDNLASEFLGGQNAIGVWAASSESIDLSNASYLDIYIKNIIADASWGYNNGELASVDDALNYINEQCESSLGLLHN